MLAMKMKTIKKKRSGDSSQWLLVIGQVCTAKSGLDWKVGSGKRECSVVAGSAVPREQMKDEGWPRAGCFGIRQ